MSGERKSRGIIIGLLCAIIIFMGVGFAASLSSILKINGNAEITGRWNVQITNITSTNTTGKATAGSPTFTATTATFNATLAEPGDSVTYRITVTNSGNIAASLDDVVEALDATTNNAIVYSYGESNPAKGTKLAAGDTHTFDVTVTYPESAVGENAPTEADLSRSLTLTLTYVQDMTA